jgi:hypothetical protein
MTFGTLDISGLISAAPPPSFNFRIVAKPAADLDVYNAPWGYSVTRAARDGVAVGYRGNVVLLEEDGVYAIGMQAEYAETSEIEVEIHRDTTAPQFRLNGISGGRSTGLAVTLEYLSDDVASTEVFKDGEAVRLQADGVISDPGRYYVTVYDHAGNYATAGFEMLYRMNEISVALLFGIVALLAALLILVLQRGRRDLRVR